MFNLLLFFILLYVFYRILLMFKFGYSILSSTRVYGAGEYKFENDFGGQFIKRGIIFVVSILLVILFGAFFEKYTLSVIFAFLLSVFFAALTKRKMLRSMCLINFTPLVIIR